MAIQVLTKEDLQQFKVELLTELKQIFNSQAQSGKPMKQWLKSYEVREIMSISRSTLQTLRSNGTLKATKIGGLMFYAADDISKLMGRQNNHPR